MPIVIRDKLHVHVTFKLQVYTKRIHDKQLNIHKLLHRHKPTV